MANIIYTNQLNNNIWRLSFLYIIVFTFVTPLYKFCEIYFSFPHINISGIRFFILCSVLFLLLFKIKLPYNEKYALYKLLPVIFSILIVWIIILSSLFTIDILDDNILNAYFNRVDSVLVNYTMMFIAGFYFDYKSTEYYKPIFFKIWLFYSAFILFNSSFLIGSFFIYEDQYTKILNYIFLSDGYLFISIILLNLMDKKMHKIIIWGIILLVMILIPSRANTIAFILSSIFMYMTFKNIFYFTVCISLLYGVVSLTNDSYITNNVIFKNSRVLNFDYDSDTSLKARNNIADVNRENLKKSWFFGDFMGDVRIFKEDGNYTHNIISRLEQFGVIYFVLFCFSLYLLLKYLFDLRVSKSPVYKSTLMLTIFSLPLIFFFRSFDLSISYFLVARIVVLSKSESKEN